MQFWRRWDADNVYAYGEALELMFLKISENLALYSEILSEYRSHKRTEDWLTCNQKARE